jgi:hypothetical protein
MLSKIIYATLIKSRHIRKAALTVVARSLSKGTVLTYEIGTS